MMNLCSSYRSSYGSVIGRCCQTIFKSEVRLLYSVVLRNIGVLDCIHQSGKAITDWDSQITIQPGMKGFFNILVERKGIREGKPF